MGLQGQSCCAGTTVVVASAPVRTACVPVAVSLPSITRRRSTADTILTRWPVLAFYLSRLERVVLLDLGEVPSADIEQRRFHFPCRSNPIIMIGLKGLTVLLASLQASAFTTPLRSPTALLSHLVGLRASSGGGYQPIYEEGTVQKRNPIYPKAGDVVRYYDIDGGKIDGQVFVGKITYIQKVLGAASPTWNVEVTELEDVGDGFFAEYSSLKRRSKKSMRSLEEVSPVAASYVRNEGAFKIPRDPAGLPVPRAEKYDIDTYPGPNTEVNQDVLAGDWEIYSDLKQKILYQAAVAGAAGTLLAGLIKGPADAIVYFLGAVGGFSYLFLLSVKTDTIGSEQNKFGSGLANLRFVVPLFVFVAIALANLSQGENNPVSDPSIFSTVTSEQFAAATIGFLTYRIPLFGNQIAEMFQESDFQMPGSAGIAMKLAQGDAGDQLSMSAEEELKTILVVSGPQAAGRSELVQRLIDEGDGRFVTPKTVDRVADGAVYERLESRDELLYADDSGRYGVTKEGILEGAEDSDSIVVVDADVALVKKLRTLRGARIIGVWVGLDATEKFEARLEAQVEKGSLVVPEDEDKGSFLRAKIKEIVKDIEYGIVSGVFEFTILNDDAEDSIMQLKEAAEYCFK